MTKCTQCKRPLSDSESIRRKMGSICYAHLLENEDSENSRDAIARLPWNPETKEVICQRDSSDNFNVKFNIPHSLIIHYSTGMEWGYGESGPADFAANILYWFTEDEAFARAYHQEFKCDFAAGLPSEGVTIPGAEIEAWTAARINNFYLNANDK